MRKFKFPSLQHLARQWRETPESVKATLLQFAKNAPTFSYDCLNDAIRDLFVLNVDYEQVALGIASREKRDSVRANFLQLLPLIFDHFSSVRPDFIVTVATQYYSIGRNLMVPFRPPMLYGVGGKLVLPWFIFWKSNPLNERQNSLFITIVKEILENDPDLNNCEFQILDFSAPNNSTNRALRVSRLNDYDILSVQERDQMLEVFVEGFSLATDELANLHDMPIGLHESPMDTSNVLQREIPFPK